MLVWLEYTMKGEMKSQKNDRLEYIELIKDLF